MYKERKIVRTVELMGLIRIKFRIYCVNLSKWVYFRWILSDDDLEEFLKAIITANDRGISPLRNASNDLNWSFGQALFFSTTVVTTIGKSFMNQFFATVFIWFLIRRIRSCDTSKSNRQNFLYNLCYYWNTIDTGSIECFCWTSLGAGQLAIGNFECKIGTFISTIQHSTSSSQHNK